MTDRGGAAPVTAVGNSPSRGREIEPWMVEDALGSFTFAIREIARRVKAGEPAPTTGYFQR